MNNRRRKSKKYMKRNSKKNMKSKRKQIGCYRRKTARKNSSKRQKTHSTLSSSIKYITIKMKKTKKRNMRKNKKGGFGPGSDPFIGAPWDPTIGGYYYANSPLGVSPGGQAPYYAQNATPSPQHGGFGMPDFITGPYYSATTSLVNMGNQISGVHKIPSPDPTKGAYQGG